jgi:hypothetical protein
MQPTSNLSTGGPKLGKIEVERLDRDSRIDITTTLPPEKLLHIAVSFTKFDRKQNTRLWPFIFTGITRSPPHFE